MKKKDHVPEKKPKYPRAHGARCLAILKDLEGEMDKAGNQAADWLTHYRFQIPPSSAEFGLHVFGHFCEILACVPDHKLEPLMEHQKTRMIMYLLGAGPLFVQRMFADRMETSGPSIILPGDES